MRGTILGAIIAVALGCIGVAQAAPAGGGIAIGKAAIGLQSVEQAQWRRRRRRRRCWHRGRSRTYCTW